MAISTTRIPLVAFLAAAALAALPSALGAAPVLNGVEISDVSPSSVTVVWEVDAGTAINTVRVFEDAAGVTEVTSRFEITPAPLASGDPLATDEQSSMASLAAIRAASAAKGIARVRIDGLSPATTYYVRARSSAEGEFTEAPASGAIEVTTADLNSFVTQPQQLRVRIREGNPLGAVVLASSPQAQYPVSSVVGDGAAQTDAYVNLAQLFSAPDSNFDPGGTTAIALRIRDGGGTSLVPNVDITSPGGFAVAIASTLDIGAPESLLRMIEPAVAKYTRGEGILLAWTDDMPASSLISLYFDLDNAGQDGVQLASGLAAGPDGPGDTYTWNTGAVPDGIYWVYGTGSEGSSSYAPAPVAIDRAGADTDQDSMADLWERLYFGSLSRNGIADSDLDGRSDRTEFDDETTPITPDIRLRLVAGLNLVSLPVQPEPAMSSADLLQLIGAAAESVARVNNATQLVETTSWDGVAVSGPVFPVVAGEGYMLSAVADESRVMVGTTGPDSLDLGIGVNLVGFRSVPAGYTAYQLASALGGQDFVASIGRLESSSQRFENAAYFNGSLVGSDFPVVVGEAYFIHLKQPVNDFDP